MGIFAVDHAGSTLPQTPDSSGSKISTWGPSSAKQPSRATAAYVFTASNGWSKSTTSIDRDSTKTITSTNTLVLEKGITYQFVQLYFG